MSRRELEPLYYLDHFSELLAFTRLHYTAILRPDDLAFISSFDALQAPAAALFVRLCNRKGRYFRPKQLRYEEFGDIASLLSVLLECRFTHVPSAADADGILQSLSRQELFEVISRLQAAGIAIDCKRSALKPALLSAARSAVGDLLAATGNSTLDVSVRQRAMQAWSEFGSEFVVQGHDETLAFILFLYFGRLEDNLSRLAMRDLGLIRTNNVDTEYSPRFDSADDAWNSFELAKLALALKSVGDMRIETLRTHHGWLSALPAPATELGRTLFDKCVFRLGAGLETIGEQGLAAALYETSDNAQAVEKSIRLWHRLDQARAKSIVAATLAQPGSDDAYLFALDFQARKYDGALAEPDDTYPLDPGKRRRSDLTELLRAASVSRIDEAFRHEPEAALARRLTRNGARVVHTENRIWRSLFALAFWPELYESSVSRFSSDFQHMPAGLSDGSFYASQRTAIDAVLQLDRDALKSRIMTTLSRCYGQVNSFTGWTPNLGKTVCDLLDLAPLEGMRSVLRRLVECFDANRSGFPDLMVVENGRLRFIEVKAEGDQLRRHQLKQLIKLREAGFEVAVERVEWIVDPDQPYAVVDVETTGGNAHYGRLTEVGAVIMQSGEITSSFQTLINPERRIPANIVALTGITQEMVADAPVFPAIADDLRSFLEGNIFVAHNVRFDYGFIQQSYRRIEQSIRLPTLCTCAMMKKHKPGLASYSLKNLSREFGVNLDQHHRALSDARAAAGLLQIINQSRMKVQSD